MSATTTTETSETIANGEISAKTTTTTMTITRSMNPEGIDQMARLAHAFSRLGDYPGMRRIVISTFVAAIHIYAGAGDDGSGKQLLERIQEIDIHDNREDHAFVFSELIGACMIGDGKAGLEVILTVCQYAERLFGYLSEDKNPAGYRIRRRYNFDATKPSAEAQK